jgi:hypothetical protein
MLGYHDCYFVKEMPGYITLSMGYKLTFILAKVKKQAIINWLEGSGGVPSAEAGVF